MKSKKILSVLSIIIITGFSFGFMIALDSIISNRYIEYQMARMIAFNFQKTLNKWILLAFFISFLIILIIQLILKLIIFNYKLRFLLSCIICLIFFFCGGWLIKHYFLLTNKLHPLNLLSGAGIFIFSILLWLILVKIKKEKINKILKNGLRIVDKKYIRKLAFCLFSFLIILNLSIFIESKTNTAKKINVIWFLIDALRADHLGCYNYQKDTSPFIDKFANEAILFRYAYSQESYTQASVPSFFTSTYPLTHKVLYDRPNIDILDSRFVTLAEILKNMNYNTAAFVFNPHLKARFNFGQGFDLYDDNKEGFDKSLPRYEAYETAKKIFKKLNKFLSKNQKRPIFLYLHYRDVHTPYAPPPPYHKIFLPNGIQPTVDIIYNKKIPFTKNNVELIISQYDGEIKYTDQYIKKTMELLKNNHINLKNSIIIITADHGEEFFDYHPEDTGGQSHGRTLYMEQIHVPLIMSIPNITSPQKIINSKVELIDIAPTILEVLNIDYEKYNQFQGKSLIPLIRDSDINFLTAYSGGNHGRGVIFEGEWKYYYFDKFCKEYKEKSFIKPSKDYNYIFGEELYNINIDPKETKNLIDKEKAIAWNLKEQLWIYKEKLISEKDSKSVKLDSKTKEQLKSLGYVQ